MKHHGPDRGLLRAEDRYALQFQQQSHAVLLGCAEAGLRPLEATGDTAMKGSDVVRKDWESSDVTGASRSRAIRDHASQSRTSYAPSMTPIFNEYVEADHNAGGSISRHQSPRSSE